VLSSVVCVQQKGISRFAIGNLPVFA